MSLTLKIFARGTEGSSLLGERVLEGERVTVGRSKQCTLSLEDPEMVLSRVHAELVKIEQGYLLDVLSKNSPVLVNGQTHASGSKVRVRAGDILTLDTYELEIVSTGDTEPDPKARPEFVAPLRPAPEHRAAVPRRIEPAAPLVAPRQRIGMGAARANWLAIGAVAIAGVLALVLLWPMLKGVVPGNEAQKKADQKIAQLEDKARSLIKLLEGDRNELKEAVAVSNREIERLEGLVRTTQTSQARAPLEAALREARRAAGQNSALEDKLREQSEGPRGLPKAEGNLGAASAAAKGGDRAEALRLLEDAVGSLTQIRADIKAERGVAQTEQERRRYELQVAEAFAKKDPEVRVEASAKEKPEARQITKPIARPNAAMATQKRPAPVPRIQVAQSAQAARMLRVLCEDSDKGAEISINGTFKGECPVDILVGTDALRLRVVKKGDAAGERVFEQDVRMDDEKMKIVRAVLSAPRNNAQTQAAAPGCLGKLSGAWTHPVGGTWTFNGNQGTLVLNSINYGPRAQQITVLSLSSCDNDTMTYRIVRAALVNTVDSSMAYDKTPANAPTLPNWVKVHTQPYSISGNGLKFGNYTYAKR